MKIYNKITDLIGKTPLLELKNIEEENGLEATVAAKLEYFNPAGSVKDRIARAMIDNAEEKRKHRNRPFGRSRLKRLQDHTHNARNDER